MVRMELDMFTVVHHTAEGRLFGIFNVMRPVVAWMARAERWRTVRVLKDSLDLRYTTANEVYEGNADEAAEVMRAAAGGPPDRVKMAEIMRRHGLTAAP